MSNAVLAAKIDAVVGKLGDVTEEIRALRATSVGRELYDAHRAATDTEIARIRDECRASTERIERELRAEREARGSMRRQLLVTGVAGVLAFVSSLTVAILT